MKTPEQKAREYAIKDGVKHPDIARERLLGFKAGYRARDEEVREKLEEILGHAVRAGSPGTWLDGSDYVLQKIEIIQKKLCELLSEIPHAEVQKFVETVGDAERRNGEGV